MTARILVVDDEPPIRALVSEYLLAEGYIVEELGDGRAAVERFARLPEIDLAILDVRMPTMDGLEALREIRRTSECYVIMLTAAAEETDRVVGLAVGADDYVVKPFSPRELVARVKAVLRRRRDGSAIDGAAPAEPVAMASSPGRVFARHQLIERVWGRDFFGEERIVDVHVGNLRKALGEGAADARVIGTVRGVGYRFLPEPDEDRV